MIFNAWRWSKFVFLLALIATAGCGKSSSDNPDAGGELKSQDEKKPPAGEDGTKPAVHDRLHQTFRQATRQEPPADERPADVTMTGKSIGKLYGKVVELWDTIRFVKPDGTRLNYSATIETDLGNIEIALDADRAPNHVRSFVALSKAGYYDGLVFDRVHQEESISPDPARCEEIEAGCPLGTGEAGKSSIGYWLKPEISEGITHEEGAVGACHGLEKDTAACKFYIALDRAPYLDGQNTIFGKVTHGLETARKIYLQPSVLVDEDVDGSRRPLHPVVIRKVTIQVHETRESVSRQ